MAFLTLPNFEKGDKPVIGRKFDLAAAPKVHHEVIETKAKDRRDPVDLTAKKKRPSLKAASPLVVTPADACYLSKVSSTDT